MPYKETIVWKDELSNLKQYTEKGYTLQAIGDIYNVTRERIRQVLRQYKIVAGSFARRKNKEASWYKKRGNKLQDHYWVKRQKFSSKKANAKRAGIVFTLQFGDLHWPDKCPILGIDINYFNDGLEDSSPSIDRLDPNVGYTAENCVVISWRANRIKNNGTAEEHQKIASFLSTHLV